MRRGILQQGGKTAWCGHTHEKVCVVADQMPDPADDLGSCSLMAHYITDCAKLLKFKLFISPLFRLLCLIMSIAARLREAL